MSQQLTEKRAGSTSTLSPAIQMARIAVNYLRGRKLRTALTTLAIVFGVGLIFAVNLALPSFMDALKRSMSATEGKADLSISGVTGEAFAPDKAMQAIKGVPGVKAASPVLERPIVLPTTGDGSVGKAPQISLIGIDPTSAQMVRAYIITEGRFLEPGDTNKVLVPAGIADIAPQLKVGAVFPLITSSGLQVYQVVGLLADKVNAASPQLYIPLADAQKAFNQNNLANALAVSFEAGVDREAVKTNILTALGNDYRAETGNANLGVYSAAEIGFAIFDVMGLLALFLGAFLIFNTFRTIVLERRHDLALLRAIGAERRQIMQMILIEGLIQGLGGSILGILLGYFLSLGLMGLVSKVMAQVQMQLGSQVSLNLNAGAVLGALFLGVTATLAAAFWPARAASKISPLAALRPATASDVRKAARWGLRLGIGVMLFSVLLLVAGTKSAGGGALLFLVGMVIAAPGLVMPLARLFSPFLSLWFAREGDLAQGNLVRQPGRAAITMSTLMIGLASLIMIAALVLSFSDLLTNLVGKGFSSDITLMPQVVGAYGNVVGADENLTNTIRAVPDVERVAGLRYAASKLNGQEIAIYGIDPVNHPKITPLDFSAGDPDTAYAQMTTGRNILVNSLGASTLKTSIGNDVVLQTASGPQTYRVVGIANDLMSFKLTGIFMSQEILKTDFNKAEDVMIMVKVTPGADKNAVLKAVQKAAEKYPQFTVKLSSDYYSLYMDLSVNVMQLFYVLALLILIPAALGLLNTLTINVLERTREIGIMRAVGGSRTQVRRVVTAEALLLGLFGAAMGTLAGVAMSYGFIMAFAGVGWKMPYIFPVVGVIAAIIVGVLLALFAAVLPARSAAKLDIIRALQYE